MPDRFGDSNFQTFEVNVVPAKRQEFTDSQTIAASRRARRALPNGQLAEKQLEFAQFENVRNFLSLRALAHELDGISINPLVTHCVTEESAHKVSNLCLRSPRSLDATQPLFYGDRLYLFKTMCSPTGQNPDLQVALIRSSRSKRFASLIFTSKFFQPVMSDQFSDRAWPAFGLRGFLVSVDAQCLGRSEGCCLRRQRRDCADDCLPALAAAIGC